TKEYKELVQSLTQHDPPRGSKESWSKLTGAFVDSASALEKAVQAKEKDAAVSAHKAISASCMACHQQHRGGPGGMMGGFGPPGKVLGPPGKEGGFSPPGKGFDPPPGRDGGNPPAESPDSSPPP